MKNLLSLNWLFIALLPFALTFISCDDDDEMDDELEIPANVLEGCCGIPPVSTEVGPGKVYIPNAFTPDRDGLNDLFTIFAGDSIARIDLMQILDSVGTVIFENELFEPNRGDLGWDGTSGDSLAAGLFNYKFIVRATDNTTKTIEGQACSIPCIDGTISYSNFSAQMDCAFPVQHDGLGEFDPVLPSFEEFNCVE